MTFRDVLGRTRIGGRDRRQHCFAVRVIALALPLAIILTGCGAAPPARLAAIGHSGAGNRSGRCGRVLD